jgi:hypothetical protein
MPIKLPLSGSEARLLRSLLEVSATCLRADAKLSRGLTRFAQEFAADEVSNIRERLEGIILRGVKSDGD